LAEDYIILKTVSDIRVSDLAVALSGSSAVGNWHWLWRVAVTVGNSLNSAPSAGTIAWLYGKETGSGKALF
jgi:hypothetical protein